MFGIDPYYISWLMDLSDFYRRKINVLRSAYSKRNSIIQRASLSMKIAILQAEFNLVEEELSSYADLVWKSDKIEL